MRLGSDFPRQDAWTLAVGDNGVGEATDAASTKRGGLGTVIVDALVKQSMAAWWWPTPTA